MLKTSTHSPSTCFKANCQIQFWISKGPAMQNLSIEIIPYYYCHDLLVLVSVSPESAVPSYKSKIPLQSNPFILFPSSILTIRRWWRRMRLISRPDWPLNAVFLIVRAMKSFFGLDLNNWSKINGEWSNYRQLWSKDRHCRWQMLGGRQGTKCPKKASISPNLVRCKSTICPGNGIFAERKTSDY